MYVRVQQWGNSLAVRIPSVVVKQLHLGSGVEMVLDASEEGITLKPAKERRRYTLAEMLAQCDLEAPMSDGMAEWLSSPAVGSEQL